MLPTPFKFFGNDYNALYMSNNGILSLDQGKNCTSPFLLAGRSLAYFNSSLWVQESNRMSLWNSPYLKILGMKSSLHSELQGFVSCCCIYIARMVVPSCDVNVYVIQIRVVIFFQTFGSATS